MDPVALFLIGLWGILVSTVESQFGTFENLPPEWKQLINAALAVVVPLAVSLVDPFWRPELGDAAQFFTYVGIFVAPIVAWLINQAWFFSIRNLKTGGDRAKAEERYYKSLPLGGGQ